MNFLQKLQNSIEKNTSLLCIGLDPELEKLPQNIKKLDEPFFEFNKAIIDATHDLVCVYKPNIAFYEAYGIDGLKQLKKTIEYIHAQYIGIPVILDAKRADTENTSEQYAKSIFDELGADAVTVNPYLGFDGIQPFLEREEKGVIVLCKTSNPGAADFQDLITDGEPLYIKIAQKIVKWNKKYGNCLMVVGSTWPDQMKKIREIAPHMFFLVPGTGPQGGDLEKTLENGLTKEKSGLMISYSRGIIYASRGENFVNVAQEKAKETRDLINKFR